MIRICQDRQRLLDEKGHALVIGGPGAGKTTIALKKAIKHIEENLNTGQSILFLSFSKAAVARAVESANEWMPQEYLKNVSIQTFHSFFWSIIKTHSYLLGAPKKLTILLPHDEKALSKGLKEGDEGWEKWSSEREHLFFKEGKIAFDLFAPIALRLLSGSPQIKSLVCSKYPLVIVDEAQDTDEEQWSIIRILASDSQLVCLADLEQQIYTFRKGVNAERVSNILNHLAPLRIDLGTQNNRSPDTEILRCGNDILSSCPKNEAYQGVSARKFNPRKIQRNDAIRSAVGQIFSVLRTIDTPSPNVAILTTTNKGVTTIVEALRGDETKKLIPHKILFDETKALLSSRLIAFLLEPKVETDFSEYKITFLTLLSDVFRSTGTKTALQKTEVWHNYIRALKNGEKCKVTNLIQSIEDIFSQLSRKPFSGNPSKDWLLVRNMLKTSKNKDLHEVATAVEYLMVFNRKKIISMGLSASWQSYGSYESARNVVDTALTQSLLMSDDNDSFGLHVMTMHKSKGKQFDGVILFHEDKICPFTTYGDRAPYEKSRKLLRVAVTRAKKHVLFLTDAFNPPEILSGFKL
ncbi:TPA: ATP-dependent helicase [Legionella pneumophila]|nr:ATP-dependent helicase [Legionella pneumophila]HBD9410568.1 ATP-dependent helicase [Legionella pneumophila]